VSETDDDCGPAVEAHLDSERLALLLTATVFMAFLKRGFREYR
jgi:hypothetical protein